MAQMTLNPDYVQMLILKVRAIMVQEETDTPNVASNASDDEMPFVLQETEGGNMSREEVVEEIQGLSPEEQAELVALMWLGRGDGEADDWSDLVEQAVERREVATEIYLLDHPMVADHWAEGLDMLGEGGRLDEVEEV